MKAAGKRKRLARLVRALDAADSLVETDFDQPGCILLTGSPNVRILVTSDDIQLAVTAGLAVRTGTTLEPTPQVRSFIARYDAKPDEAHGVQHRLIRKTTISINGERRDVTRNDAEAPLDRLRRARDRSGAPWLSEEGYAAGERLRRDFDRANLEPQITSRWELTGSGSGMRNGEADLADSALAARDRLQQVRLALGPELAGVALDVCGYSKGLELVERERLWPPRSAKLMLRTALDLLALHYGTKAGVRPPHARRS